MIRCNDVGTLVLCSILHLLRAEGLVHCRPSQTPPNGQARSCKSPQPKADACLQNGKAWATKDSGFIGVRYWQLPKSFQKIHVLGAYHKERYAYIYIYMYMYTHIYIHVYIYI